MISGNTLYGIFVGGVPPESYSKGTWIKNNIIGLNYTESREVPNGDGIVISNGARVSVIESNIISGNEKDGILIFGYDEESKCVTHLVLNNKIGIKDNFTSLPNGNNGISIRGNVNGIKIGTDEKGYGEPNWIIGNKGNGINIVTEAGYSPNEVVFRKNIINMNGIRNISMDTLCNGGISPPYNISTNFGTITGFHDIPNSRIDFYRANIHDFPPSAYQWLGSTLTGSNGVFSYEVNDPTIESVSLVATDGYEFSSSSEFGYVELITDARNETITLPCEYVLSQNYPNPFNPTTTINYQIANVSGNPNLMNQSQHVTLKVYDILGNEVSTLVNEYKSAGSYEETFDASGLSSGVYFYRLTADSFTQLKEMVLIK